MITKPTIWLMLYDVLDQNIYDGILLVVTEKEIAVTQTIDRTMAGHLWQAFTTLSDTQELLGMGDPSRAHEEINHAKRHLHEVFNTLSDDEQRQAMLDTGLCTLNLKENSNA